MLSLPPDQFRHLVGRIGALCLLMIPFWLWLLGADHLEGLRSMSFSSTTGTLLRSRVVEEGSGEDKRIRAHASYRFEVQGRKYIGDQVHLSTDPTEFFQQHPVGSAVTVYYNSAEPKDCLIGQRGLLPANLSILALLGFIPALVLGYWQEGRYAGGFPFRSRGIATEFLLGHQPLTLTGLCYWPFGLLAMVPVSWLLIRFGVWSWLDPAELSLLMGLSVLPPIFGCFRAISANRQLEWLRIEPGRYQVGHSCARKLTAIFVERESAVDEDGTRRAPTYQIGLRSDNELTHLLAVYSRRHARSVAQALAGRGKVPLEGLVEDPVRQLILNTIQRTAYEPFSGSIEPFQATEAELSGLGFQLLTRLSPKSMPDSGLSLWQREHLGVELCWKGKLWLVVRSVLRDRAGKEEVLCVTNADFVTAMPRLPYLAWELLPGQSLHKLLEEQERLVGQARAAGWEALPYTEQTYHQLEAEQVRYWRRAFETMPEAEFQDRLARFKNDPMKAQLEPEIDLSRLEACSRAVSI